MYAYSIIFALLQTVSKPKDPVKMNFFQDCSCPLPVSNMSWKFQLMIVKGLPPKCWQKISISRILKLGLFQALTRTQAISALRTWSLTWYINLFLAFWSKRGRQYDILWITVHKTWYMITNDKMSRWPWKLICAIENE